MNPQHPTRLGRVRCLAGILALVVATTVAYAHSRAEPGAEAQRHPTGHVYDRLGVTWPPQPRGITGIIPRGNLAAEEQLARARAQLAAALERVALLRGDVRQALGGRYTRIAVVEDDDKSEAPTPPRLVYFSHARNATVEVTVQGQNVREVKSIPPSDYQPEITDEEITEAEGIARAHFAALGRKRVSQLEAFGILAYKPTGNGFYDTRVIYISFHPDNDSDPEFAAWVDLSNRRVLRSLEENQLDPSATGGEVRGTFRRLRWQRW
jgi:hypothetical protein